MSKCDMLFMLLTSIFFSGCNWFNICLIFTSVSTNVFISVLEFIEYTAIT